MIFERSLGDGMFLGFCPTLIKFFQIYSLLTKFRLNFAQIQQPNLPKKCLLGDAAASTRV